MAILDSRLSATPWGNKIAGISRGQGAGSPSLENSVERLIRDWLLSELPNISSRP